MLSLRDNMTYHTFIAILHPRVRRQAALGKRYRSIVQRRAHSAAPQHRLCGNRPMKTRRSDDRFVPCSDNCPMHLLSHAGTRVAGQFRLAS